MNEPLVSIIVPVYKVEPYLCECVDSIFAQTYHNWELILVDDGSPDNCGAMCDGFAQRDSRVKVIHQENQGISVARNTGFDASTGEYVCFIDSDDSVAPDYLEKLVEAIERESADMAVCSFCKYDDSTKEILEIGGGDVHVIAFGEKRYNTFACVWGKVFRRTFLLRYDIRFETARFVEDVAFSLSTILLSQTVAVADTYYYYRRRSDSLSTTKNTSRPWSYEAFENSIRRVGAVLTDEDDRRILEYIAIKFLCAFMTILGYRECKTSRKELCAYTARIIRQYFPDAIHNPYIFGRGRIREFSVIHHIVVKACVLSYQLHALYLFSAYFGFVIRTSSTVESLFHKAIKKRTDKKKRTRYEKSF